MLLSNFNWQWEVFCPQLKIELELNINGDC